MSHILLRLIYISLRLIYILLRHVIHITASHLLITASHLLITASHLHITNSISYLYRHLSHHLITNLIASWVVDGSGGCVASWSHRLYLLNITNPVFVTLSLIMSVMNLIFVIFGCMMTVIQHGEVCACVLWYVGQCACLYAHVSSDM